MINIAAVYIRIHGSGEWLDSAQEETTPARKDQMFNQRNELFDLHSATCMVKDFNKFKSDKNPTWPSVYFRFLSHKHQNNKIHFHQLCLHPNFLLKETFSNFRVVPVSAVVVRCFFTQGNAEGLISALLTFRDFRQTEEHWGFGKPRCLCKSHWEVPIQTRSFLRRTQDFFMLRHQYSGSHFNRIRRNRNWHSSEVYNLKITLLSLMC